MTVTSRKPEKHLLVLDCHCVNQNGIEVIRGTATVKGADGADFPHGDGPARGAPDAPRLVPDIAGARHTPGAPAGRHRPPLRQRSTARGRGKQRALG